MGLGQKQKDEEDPNKLQIKIRVPPKRSKFWGVTLKADGVGGAQQTRVTIKGFGTLHMPCTTPKP